MANAGGDSSSNSNSDGNSYHVIGDDRGNFNDDAVSSSSSSSSSSSIDLGSDSSRQDKQWDRKQSDAQDNVISIPAVSPYPKNVLEALLDKYNETRFLTRNVLKGQTASYNSVFVMLCLAMSCCVMTCCVMICYVILCHVMVFYDMSHPVLYCHITQ